MLKKPPIPVQELTRRQDGLVNPLLSVIMPVYNEGQVVGEVLRRVAAVEINKEIIIVDDCSTDSTVERIQQFADECPETLLTLLQHERNMGKTAAVRDGLAVARGNIVVIQDADLENDPNDFPRLIKPILDGQTDVVYGSRFMGGSFVSGLISSIHRLVNKSLTFASNLATGLHVSDMETCYKMIRRDLLRGIRIESTGFGFEVEITAKLARKGAKIMDIPISYNRRGYRDGKKINAWDGLTALWWIVRFALFA